MPRCPCRSRLLRCPCRSRLMSSRCRPCHGGGGRVAQRAVALAMRAGSDAGPREAKQGPEPARLDADRNMEPDIDSMRPRMDSDIDSDLTKMLTRTLPGIDCDDVVGHGGGASRGAGGDVEHGRPGVSPHRPHRGPPSRPSTGFDHSVHSARVAFDHCGLFGFDHSALSAVPARGHVRHVRRRHAGAPRGGACLQGIAPGAGRTAARTQAADARLPSPSFTFINLVCRSDAVCSALKSREAVTLCRSRRAGISAPYSSCGNFRRTRMCGRG